MSLTDTLRSSGVAVQTTLNSVKCKYIQISRAPKIINYFQNIISCTWNNNCKQLIPQATSNMIINELLTPVAPSSPHTSQASTSLRWVQTTFTRKKKTVNYRARTNCRLHVTILNDISRFLFCAIHALYHFEARK